MAWFGASSSQSKNRSPMGGLRAPTAGQTLKFLFLPDFKTSASPLADSGQMFTRIVAFVFAQQGLFPRNHPALNSKGRINLVDVFRVAYSNLRWTKAGAPQIMFYFAIVGMLISSVLALLSMAVGLMINKAFAGPFDFAGAGDISCQIIHYLFLTSTMACGNGIFYSGQGDVQAGISAIFAFYSNCMLVFAAFILMYHLIAMVAETAHQGVILGKKANQIWAPIRLIVAVGLLVPINGNLSTGQKIVIQIASWGSGMGSQAWITFLSHFSGGGMGGGLNFTIAGNTDGAGIVVGMTRNYACMHAYNKFVNASQNYQGKDKATVFEDPVGTNTVLFTNKLFSERSLCGGYRYPTTQGGVLAGAIYSLQMGVFESFKGEWSALGDEIQQAFHPMNDPKPEPPPDGAVTVAIDGYEGAATFASMAGGIFGMLLGAFNSTAAMTASMGWPAAGAFIFALAKSQHAVIDAFGTSGPHVLSPDLKGEGVSDRKSLDIMQKTAMVMANVDKWIQNRGLAAVSVFIPRNNILAGSWSSKITDLTFNASMPALFSSYAFQQAGVFGPNGILLMDFKGNHPLTEFVGLGQRWLMGSLKLIGMGVAMSTSLTDGASSGRSSTGTSNHTSYMGVSKGSALAASLLVSLGQIGLTLGILIAFYVPLIPFIKFLFATLSWVVSIFETVLAIPVIAIAHLTVDGDHLPGKLAMQAYFQIMAVFLKPLMMVMGLLFGLLCFAIAAGIMNSLYLMAVAASGGAAEMIGRAVFAILYMMILYTCATASFKTIDFFSQNAVRWIGANSWFEKMGDEQFITSQLQNFGGMLGMQYMQNMQKMAQAAQQGGGGGQPIQGPQSLSQARGGTPNASGT